MPLPLPLPESCLLTTVTFWAVSRDRNGENGEGGRLESGWMVKPMASYPVPQPKLKKQSPSFTFIAPPPVEAKGFSSGAQGQSGHG